MSSTERLANEFDLKLFNLSSQATRLADDSRIKDESDRWQEIALLLAQARHHARALMHPADVAKTQS